MQLHAYKKALLRELETAHAREAYAHVTDGHAVLAGFSSPVELATSLHGSSRPAAQKAEVVAALIDAAQTRRHGCFGGILFVGFHPALLKLASQLRGHRRSGRDVAAVESVVASAFLEAVHRFPATQRSYAPLGLFFATRRLAIHALRNERTHEVSCEPGSIAGYAAAQVDPEQALICREVAPMYSHEKVCVAVGKLGVRRSRKVLELLGTLQDPAPLSKQLRRRAAGQSADSVRRTYLRIQKARHRLLRSVALKQVRDELSSIHETLPLLEQEGWQ